MILDAYVGVLAALLVGGVILVAAGLRGTHEQPHRPGVPDGGRFYRWWYGTGVTTGERRVRQGLLVGALVAVAVAFVLTGVPVVALLAGVAVPGVPWLWRVGKREERAIDRAEALGEWTRRLKDQLSTGAGLISAIVGSAGVAPAAIAEPVQVLAARLQAGNDPRWALHRFASDLDDPVAEHVVAALLLHVADRGEHLTEVLGAIASDAGRQVSMRREVHAKRTQPRTTVRFMTVFGLIVVAVLARGDLISAYTTPRGQLVLLALAGAFIGTLAWVRSLTRPPAQPRFLRTPGTGVA